MADTGFKSPTSTGETNNDWTNPSNAFASDDNDAVTGSVATNTQDYYDFSFGLPTIQKIDGIEVAIEGAYSSLIAGSLDVYLSWDGGTTWTASKNTGNFGATDSTLTVGGSTDTWGRTWAESDFTNANFRLKAHPTSNRGTDVDHIQIKVYYTEKPQINLGPQLQGVKIR